MALIISTLYKNRGLCPHLTLALSDFITYYKGYEGDKVVTDKLQVQD
jgi:hypothetical protein